MIRFTCHVIVSGDEQYIDEARKLLDFVKSGLTERERYIKSVVEAALMRHEAALGSK